jgi:hypothetical protein
MPVRVLSDNDKLGFREKLVMGLEPMVSEGGPVDIVTFCESPEYLNQTLFPRQRLALKLWYKLPLGQYPCGCLEGQGGQHGCDPRPDCPYCEGTGVYDELADTRKLLSRTNPYAQLFFPGINAEEAYTLADDALRARLLSHWAHVFEIVGGRGGGKSVDGGLVASYELYDLIRLPNPWNQPGKWRMVKGDPIGVANVATNEEQAKIMYQKLLALVAESPWFNRRQYRPLETILDFTGRNISARSFHSNSASTRGGTNKYAFLDEYAHFNQEGGKLSDSAMYAALGPSVTRFGVWAKIMMASTPLNQAGVFWDFYDKAKKGQNPYVIVMQVATWEMHPQRTREDAEIQNAYLMDSQKADMEYGAQFANQRGNFLPRDKVLTCSRNDLGIEVLGVSDRKYVIHVDLSKRHDKTVLGVGWYDPDTKKVRLVHVHFFDQEEDFITIDGKPELNLDVIEAYILDLYHKGFQPVSVTFDQFNSMGIVQRLRAALPPNVAVQELTFTEKLNMDIYQNLRTLITGGGIEWYAQAEPERQLMNLTRTFKRNGKWKVEAPVGDYDDAADVWAAVAYMALLAYSGSVSGVFDAGFTKDADELEAHGPRTLTDPEWLEHAPDCDAGSCVMGCPIQEWYMEQMLNGALTMGRELDNGPPEFQAEYEDEDEGPLLSQGASSYMKGHNNG